MSNDTAYTPDFLIHTVTEKVDKRTDEDYLITPDFVFRNVSDLVVKGGRFYAYWTGTNWSTSTYDLVETVDRASYTKVTELQTKYPGKKVTTLVMNRHRSRVMTEFKAFCSNRETTDETFNSKILFSDHIITREDFATYQLPYKPMIGDTPAFDELFGTLYRPDELDKIMWILGCLFSGDIQYIQRFLFIYGAAGTGKGTVIKLIKMMLMDYVGTIDLRTFTSSSEFATGQLTELPVLIDEDTDLSRIQNEQNLLKATAHEPVMVRRLNTSAFPMIHMGLIVSASNERYSAKNKDSGINRRALVVHPSNKKVSGKRYEELMNLVAYEIPYIVKKCMDTYKELGRDYYDNYRDVDMVVYNDPFLEFMRIHYPSFKNGVSKQRLIDMYRDFLTEKGFDTRFVRGQVDDQAIKYFESCEKSYIDPETGDKIKNYFTGLVIDNVLIEKKNPSRNKLTVEKPINPDEILFQTEPNWFDDMAESYPAQLTTDEGFPRNKWSNVYMTLKDIDVRELHYVRVPENHIVLDFDIPSADGGKDLIANLKAALKYPETYMEVSKSGGGIHLHYIYDGDVDELSSRISDNIEIKVFKGNSSLRRKFIRSNGKPISHISTGLPLREKSMFTDIETIVWTDKKLRSFVERCLEKEHHGATTPEMDFIKHTLDQAIEGGVTFDLSDMYNDLLSFAMSSTNQSEKCLKVLDSLTLKHNFDDYEEYNGNDIVENDQIVFFDIEVFKNVNFLVYSKIGVVLPDNFWKRITASWNGVTGNDPEIIKWLEDNRESYGIMINPSPKDVEWLMKRPLAAYNNLGYDNHILYGMYLGETPEQLYVRSQNIINGKPGGRHKSAYNISYIDVFEMLDKKQSLKKWQIEMGLPHVEHEHPWDKPLPLDSLIDSLMYCHNDTYSLWNVFLEEKHGVPSYTARKILSQLTNSAPNTKTQTLAERFLFGDDPRPQDKFVHYDLAQEFPGYTFDIFRKPKSDYLGKDPSEGGYVHSEPGVYKNVIYIDVDSLHPWSLINANYFGPYTEKFKALVMCRMHIKYGRLEEAQHAFDDVDPELSAKLKPFLSDPALAKDLGYSMKIIINIVYGMTSAKFDNKFRHKDNHDNIVAKRGALFMITLQDELEKRGVDVVHVKTDSMKLVNWTQEDVDYAFKRANDYGYQFSHECTFEKMALVDKANLVGYTTKGHWETVGSKFSEPFVEKTLFTGKSITEKDFGMTKEAKIPIYIGDDYIGKNAHVYASLSGSEMYKLGEVDLAQKIQSRMLKPVDKHLPKSLYVGLPDEVVLQNRIDRISKELELDSSTVGDIINSGYKPFMVDKKDAVTGTKGFKWKLFSEYTNNLDIDMKYYNDMVEDAVTDIYAVGDGNVFFGGTKWERT